MILLIGFLLQVMYTVIVSSPMRYTFYQSKELNNNFINRSTTFVSGFV